MRVQWFTNACVRITSSSGSSVLCDPWVNGGAFLGSWFHWPPLPDDFAASLLEEPCNGIYVSHLHPDHYDPNFLSAFSKARPEVPIYIAEFAHPWLKRSIAAVIKSNSKLVELPTLSTVEVAPGLNLKVFAADTCNPQVCGANVPCQINPHMRGIDSIGVFSADGFTVVNANDAMGVRLIPSISKHIGRADLLMGHYGGASPFPQCFPDIKDKKSAAAKIVESTCRGLIKAADEIDARFVMPFAGQYILGGRLVNLNQDRATLPLDDAVRLLKTMSNREIVSMTPGGVFDLNSGSKSDDFVEPGPQIQIDYLNKLSPIEFPYEHKISSEWTTVAMDLRQSAQVVADRSKKVSFLHSNSFIIGDGDNWVTINLDREHIDTSVEYGKRPKFHSVTEISMQKELLRLLSTRRNHYKGFTTLHWNQADVGSHFVWKRTGQYDLASHALLNFYGT